MPLLRYKKHLDDTFEASELNTHALAEVLTGDDSAYFVDLEVFLGAKNEWKCLAQAFRDKDVITDNSNSWFSEPLNEEDKERGYFL